jgi:hypothetical protein
VPGFISLAWFLVSKSLGASLGEVPDFHDDEYEDKCPLGLA